MRDTSFGGKEEGANGQAGVSTVPYRTGDPDAPVREVRRRHPVSLQGVLGGLPELVLPSQPDPSVHHGLPMAALRRKHRWRQRHSRDARRKLSRKLKPRLPFVLCPSFHKGGQSLKNSFLQLTWIKIKVGHNLETTQYILLVLYILDRVLVSKLGPIFYDII